MRPKRTPPDGGKSTTRIRTPIVYNNYNSFIVCSSIKQRKTYLIIPDLQCIKKKCLGGSFDFSVSDYDTNVYTLWTARRLRKTNTRLEVTTMIPTHVYLVH